MVLNDNSIRIQDSNNPKNEALGYDDDGSAHSLEEGYLYRSFKGYLV